MWSVAWEVVQEVRRAGSAEWVNRRGGVLRGERAGEQVWALCGWVGKLGEALWGERVCVEVGYRVVGAAER